MGKFYGTVGYVESVETVPGIWEAKIEERKYRGDVLRHITKWDNGQKINDDVNINNEIHILADPYAYSHLSSIRYVEYMGAKWKVTNVTVERPRLVLTIGGLYNG